MYIDLSTDRVRAAGNRYVSGQFVTTVSNTPPVWAHWTEEQTLLLGRSLRIDAERGWLPTRRHPTTEYWNRPSHYMGSWHRRHWTAWISHNFGRDTPRGYTRNCRRQHSKATAGRSISITVLAASCSTTCSRTSGTTTSTGDRPTNTCPRSSSPRRSRSPTGCSRAADRWWRNWTGTRCGGGANSTEPSRWSGNRHRGDSRSVGKSG